MKLSVLPVSYFQKIRTKEMGIEEWAREGVELGLDAIDISVILLETRDPSHLKEFRRKVEDQGISIAVASTYPDFTHPDGRERRRQREQFRRDLEDLAAVGTRIVRVTSGQAHPGLQRIDGVRWALDGMLGSVETARGADVQLVFENHAKPGVWQYPDFDFPTDVFLELARELSGTEVKLLFDCANPIAYGDDPVDLLKQVVEEVRCVHASDTARKGELKPVVIGTGLVPYPAIFAVLKENQFDGWISIEEASGRGSDGVRMAVDFVRSKWSEQ